LLLLWAFVLPVAFEAVHWQGWPRFAFSTAVLIERSNGPKSDGLLAALAVIVGAGYPASGDRDPRQDCFQSFLREGGHTRHLGETL
jgi:hypothetical protein